MNPADEVLSKQKWSTWFFTVVDLCGRNFMLLSSHKKNHKLNSYHEALMGSISSQPRILHVSITDILLSFHLSMHSVVRTCHSVTFGYWFFCWFFCLKGTHKHNTLTSQTIYWNFSDGLKLMQWSDPQISSLRMTSRCNASSVHEQCLQGSP